MISDLVMNFVLTFIYFLSAAVLLQIICAVIFWFIFKCIEDCVRKNK